MGMRFFPKSTTDNLTPPRKPPATSTTDGMPNTMGDTEQAGEYGAKHRALKMYPNGTRRSDFK